MTIIRNVAIFVFPEMEVLDFAGPFEVFNVASELTDPASFRVFTVAETAAPVKTRGLLSIHPNYSIESMPPADILVIPGGWGSRLLVDKAYLRDWLLLQHDRAEKLLSVCTGARFLGRAGLLDGLEYTTHHSAFADMRELVPDGHLITDRRYVDTRKILTAGGITAGIDAALYLVRELLGDEVLQKTLTEMEYAWSPDLSLHWREARVGTSE